MGARGMVNHGIHAKKKLDEARVTPGAHSPTGGKLMALASAGFELSAYAKSSATQFMTVLKSLSARLDAASAELAAVQPSLPAYTFTQLWDPARQDNALCCAAQCYKDNSYYASLRIEGYGVSPGTPGSIPLLAYYSASAQDNADSTYGLQFASEYAPAQFSANGYVLALEAPGTVPLQLFYSASRHDYLTVASAEGIAYANSNGYTRIDSALGWVYTSPPLSGSSSIDAARWTYAATLLANAAN